MMRIKKIYKFPYFRKICKLSPYFRPIYVFFANLHFLLSTYFDHDAFMHHALHDVPDAPGEEYTKQWQSIQPIDHSGKGSC